MDCLGIIPARYASARFPGKALSMINGKSMIRRVYERCAASDVLRKILVATDDQRIFDHVKSFGGSVMMTSPHHRSGTERCAEVCGRLRSEANMALPDIIINIQGDEPYIHPDQISLVASCFDHPDTNIATLARIIRDPEELNSPHTVKVVMDLRHRALLFSRSVIPFQRGRQTDQWHIAFPYLKHIGIYAYRAGTLMELVTLPPTLLETSESLEQLRWMEHGHDIYVSLTQHDSYAVDVPDDLEKLPKHLP